jgi:hypothetical protein
MDHTTVYTPSRLDVRLCATPGAGRARNMREHVTQTVALCVLAVVIGLAGVGCGSGSASKHELALRDLEDIVVADLGKKEASCERYSRRLNVCTVQGAHEPDRLRVCVEYRYWIQYRPMRECGIDIDAKSQLLPLAKKPPRREDIAPLAPLKLPVGSVRRSAKS